MESVKHFLYRGEVQFEFLARPLSLPLLNIFFKQIMHDQTYKTCIKNICSEVVRKYCVLDDITLTTRRLGVSYKLETALSTSSGDHQHSMVKARKDVSCNHFNISIHLRQEQAKFSSQGGLKSSLVGFLRIRRVRRRQEWMIHLSIHCPILL